MALYTRKEFFEKCGVTKGYLNVYIGRGNVVLTGKMIDDKIPKNAYFLQSCLDKKAVKNGKEPGKKIIKLPKLATAEIVDEAQKDQGKELDEHTLSKYSLELQKKELDIIKAEEDIEIAKIKRAKMAGEVIPTDLVLLLFASHFKNVTTSFHQATEILITAIAKENNLDRKQIANIRGQLIEIINKAIEDGLISSKNELKNLVTEYSMKRDRGERT